MNIRYLLRLAVLSLLIVFSPANTLFAEETSRDITEQEESISDFDDDFDEDFASNLEDEFSDENLPEMNENKSPFALSGSVNISSSYNTAHNSPPPGEADWRGLSMLKSEFFMEMDTRLPASWRIKISGNGFYDAAYSINDRDQYTKDLLDDYEQEVELRKAYIQGKITDNLDIKEGRQIVVWGKSDNIRATDILNPLDLRIPGVTDIEDLRLPVWMTKVDYYLGDWSISGITVHEHRVNKLPEFGSDFYMEDVPLPHEEIPSDSFENTEYAASINGVFTGWDIAFYYADYYEDTPHLKFSTQGGLPLPELRHAHQTMVGGDFNISLGNFLLKSEAAWFNGVRFSDHVNMETFTLDTVPGRYSKTNILAGIEYQGFTDTSICVETMNTHINGYDKSASKGGVDKDSLVSALRIQRDFFNQRLTLMLLSLIYGEKAGDGALNRLTAEYLITDSITIKGGAILYESGDLSQFESIGDNDRLFADIKYSF